MIYHGDLFTVLPTLDAESIDSCVTDPPYGIGFMNKKWDSFSPQQIDKLRKRAEVPNPNKFSETHTLKGRERRSYATPSAIEYDFSLIGLRGFQDWTASWAREVYRVLKPGAHMVVCGAPRSFHRMTSGLEDAGFEIRDVLSWLYGQGFPKSLNVEKELDLRTEHEIANGVEQSPASLEWKGWGTGLKPSWEPIVLARKPLEFTLAENVITYRTGAINIAAPIGHWPSDALLDEAAATRVDRDFGRQVSRFFYTPKPSRDERDEGCYDLPTRTAIDTVNRDPDSAGAKNPRAGAGRGAGGVLERCTKCGADAGGGRRISTCTDGGAHDFVVVGRLGGVHNIHPTVKPIALMNWLVKLITPPEGLVLDPFLGSGTTGMATRYADCQFVGIEKEAEYVEIAQKRITEANQLLYGVEEVRVISVISGVADVSDVVTPTIDIEEI